MYIYQALDSTELSFHLLSKSNKLIVKFFFFYCGNFSSLFHQAMPSGTRLIVSRSMVVRMGGGWWGSLIIFQGSGFQTWISCYLPISHQGWEFVCFPSPTVLISYLARALLVCVVWKYKTLWSYVRYVLLRCVRLSQQLAYSYVNG